MKRPHIDHIGIVVMDLDAAIGRFTALLGVPPTEIKTLPEVGLRLARFDAANVAFEIVEYTGDGALFARDVMGAEAGLNHVSIATEDLEQARAAFTAAGLVTQDGFPTAGARGPVIFFKHDPVSGVLFELCQIAAEGEEYADG